MNWHLINIKEAYDLTGSSADGLTAVEAGKRLEEYGLNEIAAAKKNLPGYCSCTSLKIL
jgi:Cation transporter/ATPase, N-terminus